MPWLLAQSRMGRNETKVQYKFDLKEMTTNEGSGLGESSNTCVRDDEMKGKGKRGRNIDTRRQELTTRTQLFYSMICQLLVVMLPSFVSST